MNCEKCEYRSACGDKKRTEPCNGFTERIHTCKGCEYFAECGDMNRTEYCGGFKE